MMKRLEDFFKMLFKALFSDSENNVIETNVSEDIVLGAPITNVVTQYENVKILIDNGHGFDTGGKKSPYSCYGVEPAIEFYEYKWNREIAKPIVERLKEMGYNADLIVTEENDISLLERVKRINKVCDEYGAGNVLMVSVHANAAGNGKQWLNAKGWSAFTTRGNTKSDKLAEFLYDAATVNFPDRKIRTDKSDGDRDWETNFYICLHSKCPAVLTENFFYDNTDDVQYILSDEGREAVIKTHIEGITNYIKDTF